jgi:hypothetical protein
MAARQGCNCLIDVKPKISTTAQKIQSYQSFTDVF